MTVALKEDSGISSVTVAAEWIIIDVDDNTVKPPVFRKDEAFSVTVLVDASPEAGLSEERLESLMKEACKRSGMLCDTMFKPSHVGERWTVSLWTMPRK